MEQIDVAVYLRVSTNKQEDERQERELMDIIKFKNYNIVEIIKEKVSGAQKNRKGIARIIQLAKEKKIKKLLVHEVSRFSREQADFHVNLNKLSEYGVSVYFHDIQRETLREDGTRCHDALMNCSFHEIWAVNERYTISMRVKSGLRNAKINGVKLGRPKASKLKCEDEIIKLFKAKYFLNELGHKVKATNHNVANHLKVSYVTVHRARKKAGL